MSSRRTNNIKALSEQLGSLQITKEVSSKYKQMDTEMSTALALAISNKNVQARIPKNIILNPEWFDSDRMKFEDWQRGMRLFLKSNRVIETNNRIIVILACLRRGITGIYTQRKLDELDKETGTYDWEEFVWEIKITFSDKMKAVDAEWKIETSKQGKKNTADFMIKFYVLAMKADIDKLHTIFLLKKNI